LNIKLQEFTKEDFPKLISWIHSAEFMKQWCGTTFHYPLDVPQLEQYVQGTKEIPQLRRVYKSVNTDIGQHIGNITLELKNKVENAAAVTCVIIGEEKYRGMGIGRIMVREVLNTAFNELNFESVYLNVYDFNKAAVKCYKNSGFTKASQNESEYAGKKAVNNMMIIRRDEWGRKSFSHEDTKSQTNML
jgi:RimJ/RimL family protein N-acetyltransferase